MSEFILSIEIDCNTAGLTCNQLQAALGQRVRLKMKDLANANRDDPGITEVRGIRLSPAVPGRSKEDELIDMFDKGELCTDTLDGMVHDMVSQDGSRINNEGVREQLSYLQSNAMRLDEIAESCTFEKES